MLQNQGYLKEALLIDLQGSPCSKLQGKASHRDFDSLSRTLFFQAL